VQSEAQVSLAAAVISGRSTADNQISLSSPAPESTQTSVKVTADHAPDSSVNGTSAKMCERMSDS
jgi:hypothetical protein